MTDALKIVYSANLLTDRALDTIALHHSSFSQTYRFVADTKQHSFKNKAGVLNVYEPFSFKVISPDKGGNQQDVQLVFDNVLGIGTAELNAAIEHPDELISCIYTVYLESSEDLQGIRYILSLGAISLNARTITATAQRKDMFQTTVPKIKYDADRFKGLQ